MNGDVHWTRPSVCTPGIKFYKFKKGIFHKIPPNKINHYRSGLLKILEQQQSTWQSQSLYERRGHEPTHQLGALSSLSLGHLLIPKLPEKLKNTPIRPQNN